MIFSWSHLFDNFLGILFQSWRWALDKFSPASLPTDFKRSKWKLLWFLEVSSLISANVWTASDQDIFRKPVAGAREDGAKGLAVGCGTGIAGKSCPDIRRSSADHASLWKSEIILKPARHSGEASCRCGKCCLWCSAFACEVLLELIEGVQDNFSPFFRSSSHKSMIKKFEVHFGFSICRAMTPVYFLDFARSGWPTSTCKHFEREVMKGEYRWTEDIV